MVDKVVKHGMAKGAVSAADMAARPFQCEWHQGCNKSFNRKSDLQRHYRIHTNERPYACEHKPCNKTFIQRSALTVHRRTHTGDKPHKCPFLDCGKCFSDSSSLARHRRIHTNDKPYICRNQRCKKAFCRKTTMTKHVRKEHPAEPMQDDQDAEYSDVEASDDELEDEFEGIKEEPQLLYPEPVSTKKTSLIRPPSEYNRNLWSLPGQAAAHRPSPLHIQNSTIPRSEAPIQKIKLERPSSTTPQRSMTDPYPDNQLQSSEFSLSRADTMPSNVTIPSTMSQTQPNGSIPQQFQLRNADNVGLWSPQHAIQESPTNLSHSSPRSATSQSHPMFTSQPYQLQSVDIPSHEQIPYPHQHEVFVPSTSQQPLDDLTVHEIHLDQPQPPSQPQAYRDMAPTPVHQNPFDGGIHQISPSDPYIAMSREISQYQDEVSSTPASTQQLPHYTTSLAEAPYQQSQYVPLDNFSTSNQVFPPNGGIFQFNEAGYDPWKDYKLEANGFPLPAQRIQEYGSFGA